MEIHGHGGDIGHDGDRPVEEEQPAGHVGALLAEEFAGIGNERAGRRTTDRQLAQSAHHQERENAAHRVCDRKTCATLRKTATSAQKQAGADGTADGDHLDMTGLQILRIAGVALVELAYAALLRCFGLRQVVGVTHNSSSS